MLVSEQYNWDVAIQLVEKGSEFEMFLKFRDILNENPALVRKQETETAMVQTPKFDFNEPFVGLERNGEIYLWLTQRLWKLSKNLPVFEYEVASFDDFDRDVWFGSQHEPTVNKVLEHYKKIAVANFQHPIIISQDGKILDGVHRICRAHLDGRKTIPAVRFEVDPEPDRKHSGQ